MMQDTPMQIRGKEYYCSTRLTLDVIGGKWKMLVVWMLGDGQPKRFGELRRLLGEVTEKILTQQLRELEADRIIMRKIYAQVPPKVEYSLTEYGKSLLPILLSMSD